MELSEALEAADDIKIEPVQKLHSYPTFNQRFWQWNELDKRAKRLTHKASLNKPKTVYSQIRKQLGHLPTN